MSQIWSNHSTSTGTKSLHKLPASPNTQKERPITKIPITGTDKVTDISTKDARAIFTKLSFPVFLDLSDSCYNIESDEFLKSCPNVLKELNLSANSLIEVSSIGHQSKLKRLVLEKNNLVEVSLKGLSSLIYLSAAYNRLATVPELSDQKELVNIDFSNNRLQDGFEEFSKLKSIEVLDLSNNNIDFSTTEQLNSKFFDHLKKLKTLEYLALDGNPIEKAVPEFRLYVINALPKLKYFNWVAIPKEEKLRASKLESEGYWQKNPIVPTQPQPQPQLQQHASLPNLSSGATTPPIPMITKPTATFIQRRPNLGGNASSFLIGSHLGRSQDRSITSSSDSSRKTDEDLDNRPLEYYLNQLLEELPPVTNVDFTLMNDRKMYLDALYNAIVDGSLNLDLMLDSQSATTTSTSPNPISTPMQEAASPASPIVQEVNVKQTSESPSSVSVQIPPPAISNLMLDDEDELLEPELPITPSLTTTNTPQPIKDVSVIRMSEENIVANTEDVKVVSPVISGTRSLNHSGSSSPVLSSSPSSGFKPVNFVSKRPASPATTKPSAGTVKPAGTTPVNRSSSPLTNRSSVNSSPPPPPGVIAKRLEQLSKGIPTTNNTPSKPPTPTPVQQQQRSGTPSELDMNKFNSEIEKALQDIQSVAEEMTIEHTKQTEKQKQQQASMVVIEPTTKQTIVPSLSEENLIEASDSIPTIAAPPGQEAEKAPAQEVSSHTTSMPVIKPSDDVNAASKKLNDLIDEYNHSEIDKQALIDNSKPISLADLVSRFEQFRSSIEAASPRVSVSQIPWLATKSDVQFGSQLGSGGSIGDCFVGLAWNEPAVFKRLYVIPENNTNTLKSKLAKLMDLKHDNLLPIKGCYIDKDNTCFIISPFVESCSLDKLITEQRFSFTNEFIINVLLGIAKALCFLHQHGYKHSSVKSTNVLVDANGNVHVRDYSLNEEKFIDRSRATVYHAPELLSEFTENDETVDQYAFGMIVWEIFLRKTPFAEESKDIATLLDEGYRPELPTSVPMVFDRLIRACWHQDSTARPNFLTAIKILGQPIQRIFVPSKSSTPTRQSVSSPLVSPLVSPAASPIGSPIIKPMANVKNLPSSPLSSSPKINPTPLSSSPKINSPLSSSPKINSTPLSSSPKINSPLSSSPKLAGAPVVPPLRSLPKPSADVSPKINSTAPPQTPTSNAKHQFSETGELKKKMSLVLEKIISMLSDESIVPKALNALENLSSNQSNIQHIVRVNIMPHLIKTFNFNSEEINELTLNVLCQLCVYEDLSNQFVSSSGLIHIVRLMNSTNLTIALSATKILTALADEQNLGLIREAGGLKVLFVTLQSTNEFLQMQSVWAASRILLDKYNQYSFIEWGGIQMLLDMMHSDNQGLAMRALLAVCCLITNEICQEFLLEAGVLSMLMNCLVSPSKLLRLHTLKIIANIGNQQSFRNLIVAESGISQIASQLGQTTDDENLLILNCLSSLLAGDQPALEQFTLSPCNAVENLLNLFVRNQSVEILKSALTVLNHLIEYEPSRLKSRRVIPYLVQQISIVETDYAIQMGCLQALISFSQHASCIPNLQKTNLIEIIAALLRVNNINIKIKTLNLISGISKTGGSYLVIINNSDLIPILHDLLSSELNQLVKDQVISAISWLTASNECRDKFNQKSVFPTLLNSISKTMSGELIERMIWAISFFCLDEDNQPHIREHPRVIDFILKCLGRNEEVLRTLAIKTILILSQKPINRDSLVEAGIVPFLLSLGSSSNKPLQLASKKILSLLN